MREFWVSSGHHLTRRDAAGRLAVTDELLLAYLARPEIMPPDEACIVERTLHQRLMNDPRAVVPQGAVTDIADADARENWDFMLGFRKRLLDAGTVEGAYLAIVHGRDAMPPLFMNQMVHLIMRNALDGCEDPYVLRAAELFFRPQRASVRDGAVVLADAELIDDMESGAHASPLTAMFSDGAAPELDVMDAVNNWTYWSRSDAHSMALNFGGDQRSRTGLATAIALFVDHLLGQPVRVTPLTELVDIDLTWFVGLDQDATALGNALWQGREPENGARERLIGLFRLEFEDAAAMLPQAAGKPVYLLLAMAADRTLRMKPQNLVVGLPLADGPAPRKGH